MAPYKYIIHSILDKGPQMKKTTLKRAYIHPIYDTSLSPPLFPRIAHQTRPERERVRRIVFVFLFVFSWGYVKTQRGKREEAVRFV